MSDRPVVLVTRRLTDAVHARLEKNYNPVFNLEDRVFDQSELVSKCQSVDAVIPCHSELFSAEVIAALPERLKVIANHSVGVDHVDLTAAKEKGVIVTNTPDVLSDATAEIAILCMLGAARRASEGDRMVREGRWDFWSPAFMVGVQTTGKRLGIIGMGRVGQVMAMRGRGFGMEIHYSNRRRLPQDLEQGAIFHETVEDLLPNCDVLSLHCPSTPETKGLMNAERLALLPNDAVLVNTARGPLIDEAALIDALKNGGLFAAGLDVFCDEPGGNPELSRLDNVFMLPHVGSATKDTRDAMGFRAIDNLDAVFAGREPGDRVA
ncbi:D-glycerate dehydrogenase [Pelagibius sp. Alg239-R121]|uniref:2-hydroxyacid dehydrogenase n=1 Tax=Pelagibius sp. Alg239-R121 TaxID=2993448 RepID=UPI0024A719F2|nr:D-glycerate dehydrogenase [Pelagibius sp. Alg239-R121]